MHDNPNIIGGERVTWAAAIVCGCIVAYGLVTIWTLLLSGLAPADLHVGARFFLKG